MASFKIIKMRITVIFASSLHLQLEFDGTCLAVEAVALLVSTFASLVSSGLWSPSQGKTQGTVYSAELVGVCNNV